MVTAIMLRTLLSGSLQIQAWQAQRKAYRNWLLPRKTETDSVEKIMLTHLKKLTVLVTMLAVPSVVKAQEPANRIDRQLPLVTANSPSDSVPQELTIVQQRAKFAADQRMLRTEWNNWIGYSPLRPNLNSSYMSNGTQRYYIPSRGVIVSAGNARAWYW